MLVNIFNVRAIISSVSFLLRCLCLDASFLCSYAISDTATNLWSAIQLKPGKHLPVRDSEVGTERIGFIV